MRADGRSAAGSGRRDRASTAAAPSRRDGRRRSVTNRPRRVERTVTAVRPGSGTATRVPGVVGHEGWGGGWGLVRSDGCGTGALTSRRTARSTIAAEVRHPTCSPRAAQACAASTAATGSPMRTGTMAEREGTGSADHRVLAPRRIVDHHSPRAAEGLRQCRRDHDVVETPVSAQAAQSPGPRSRPLRGRAPRPPEDGGVGPAG